MPHCRCRGLASLQPPSFPCTNEGHLMHAAKSCDSLLVKNSARNARGEFICHDWYLAPCVPPLPQYFWLLNLKTFARALPSYWSQQLQLRLCPESQSFSTSLYLLLRHRLGRWKEDTRVPALWGIKWRYICLSQKILMHHCPLQELDEKMIRR